MGDYHINQQGRDLIAVVDSFKTAASNLEAGPGASSAELLSAFLDAVARSPISEDDKRDVLEGATVVVEQVRQEGRLAGRAKILWNGLQKAIELAPTALKAWEALTKLWS